MLSVLARYRKNHSSERLCQAPLLEPRVVSARVFKGRGFKIGRDLQLERRSPPYDLHRRLWRPINICVLGRAFCFDKGKVEIWIESKACSLTLCICKDSLTCLASFSLSVPFSLRQHLVAQQETQLLSYLDANVTYVVVRYIIN